MQCINQQHPLRKSILSTTIITNSDLWLESKKLCLVVVIKKETVVHVNFNQNP
jgi:hypothetical protein